MFLIAGRIEDPLTERVSHGRGYDLISQPVRGVVLAESPASLRPNNGLVQDLEDIVLDIRPVEPSHTCSSCRTTDQGPCLDCFRTGRAGSQMPYRPSQESRTTGRRRRQRGARPVIWHCSLRQRSLLPRPAASWSCTNMMTCCAPPAHWAVGPGLREDYWAHRPNVERAVAQVATVWGRRLKLRHRGGSPRTTSTQAPHRREEPAQPDRARPGLARRRLGTGN